MVMMVVMEDGDAGIDGDGGGEGDDGDGGGHLQAEDPPPLSGIPISS